MGIEKRGAKRFEVELSAEVYTPKAVHAAKTRNLSTTGVCFDLDVSLQEDTTVGVSLFLVSDGIEDPDAEPLNIKAAVVWCSERDDGRKSAGMRFVDVDERAAKAIEQLLRQFQ